MSSSSCPIKTEALSKTYRLGFLLNRKVRALQGLSLKIDAGQICGILGPNGAGKSTTIKILMGLVRATSGSAEVFGRPPRDASARRDVGFMPENPAPYEYLTGREFVELAGRLVGLTGADLAQRVREVLESVEMTKHANLQIRRYSKGMVQRIGLAQAVVGRPRLLILDEPTSGLDPIGRRTIRDLILAERQRGTTVLFCTHIIPDAEALCDRVVVLVGGRLVRSGKVSELITADVPQVEVALEQVSRDQVLGWGMAFASVEALGDRVLVRAADAEAQALLAKALQAGARVAGVQPVRFTLENLFLEAMSSAGTSRVGGELT